jgi:hypothetical protein
MTRIHHLFAVAALGLAAAGCSYTSTTEAVVPPPRPVAVVPAVPAYVPPPTVVYTDPTPVQAYVRPAPPPPPAGVQAFRDEYGFRYDGQGNRIDARGNIISPHSTVP